MLLAIKVLHPVAGVFVLAELGFVLFGVELGFFIEVDFGLGGGAVLHAHGGFEHVDFVHGVGSGFEGEASFVRVEVLGHVGGFEGGCWCHADGAVEVQSGMVVFLSVQKN